MTVYRDPFSVRAEEIARREILRADVHGKAHYGPAPAPLDTRQVARLKHMRTRVADHGAEADPET